MAETPQVLLAKWNEINTSESCAVDRRFLFLAHPYLLPLYCSTTQGISLSKVKQGIKTQKWTPRMKVTVLEVQDWQGNRFFRWTVRCHYRKWDSLSITSVKLTGTQTGTPCHTNPETWRTVTQLCHGQDNAVCTYSMDRMNYVKYWKLL